MFVVLNQKFVADRHEMNISNLARRNIDKFALLLLTVYQKGLNFNFLMKQVDVLNEFVWYSNIDKMSISSLKFILIEI